jgi:putative acetyltransferase
MNERPVEVRSERPGDVEAIRCANEAAFGGPLEARIVAALRRAGAVTASLVALVEGAVVGHILFSPVTIRGEGTEGEAVGLGPMAVLPAFQRRGVGSALVRAGLAHLRAAGHRAVVVLGHPAYYPRFGFRRASELGLRWEHEAPDEAFMVLELRAEARSQVSRASFRTDPSSTRHLGSAPHHHFTTPPNHGWRRAPVPTNTCARAPGMTIEYSL